MMRLVFKLSIVAVALLMSTAFYTVYSFPPVVAIHCPDLKAPLAQYEEPTLHRVWQIDFSNNGVPTDLGNLLWKKMYVDNGTLHCKTHTRDGYSVHARLIVGRGCYVEQQMGLLRQFICARR